MRSTEIARRLAARAADVASHLFPNGKRDGANWCVGGINGQAGKSLRICLAGDKAGIWCDFGQDELRGDLFGLWKHARNLNDKDTAVEALAWLGFQDAPAPIAAPRAERINIPAPAFPESLPGSPTQSWAYLDKNGDLLGFECRYDKSDGKTYLPYTYAADGWQAKGFSKPLPLYNLPQLVAHADRQIIVCEGAKAADAAARLFPGLIVTTWPGGASRAKDADWSLLCGRNVVLWPDADEPGRKAMLEVATAIGTPLRIVDTEGLPAGWDAADFTAADGRPRDWIVSRLRAWTPPGKPAPIAAKPSKPQLAVVDADGSLRVPVSNHETEELPAGYSQDALAAAFTAKNGEWRYVSEWGKWYKWDGLRWAQDTVLTVFDLSRGICREQAALAAAVGATPGAIRTIQSANTIAAVERLARADPAHASRTDTWDANPWLLNTPGGVVDLQDGSIRPGAAAEHMTKITRIAPVGDCPLWRQFLEVATAGDADLQAFMQRMAGYCLTGITREHALFFVYGTGGNGKGTFLNMLTWILGDYGQVASMETFTEARGERHPTELAGLMGARMVSAQETEEGRRWAESRIKALTGGDPIRARFMRQDEFTFMPQFKLVIVGNHKPGLRNVDDAIKRRLHLIPFTHKIEDAQRDVRLPEKLQAEAPGILQWMIEGCLEWQRIGLSPPACVKSATENYLVSQDSLATWMAECCDISPMWSCKVSVLFTSYRNWAEQNGEASLGRKRFTEAMETRGYLTIRHSGNFWTKGLRVEEQ
jgi:putative DNA primase/helicase